MEVLLRFLYGTTAVMAVPRRSWRCRGDPTADWPNPRWPAEVLNMFKVSPCPAKVRSFDSFPRCYGDHLRNHCGTTTIMVVPLRCMPYKHRRSTAPPV